MFRLCCAALFLVIVLVFGATAQAVVFYVVTDLGTLGGSTAGAEAINNKGQVVGYSSLPGNVSGQTRAFLWTPVVPNSAAGAMQNLGSLGGTSSYAYGINNFGHVTGWAATPSNGNHVFFYDGTTMQDVVR